MGGEQVALGGPGVVLRASDAREDVILNREVQDGLSEKVMLSKGLKEVRE